MTYQPHPSPMIAIACGGTGGHLFPGLAIAEALQERGCAITLLVSPKEVDQQAVKAVVGMEIVTLPAIALDLSGMASFLRASWKSRRVCLKHFRKTRPQAVLAMGGFTSAPPILAGKACGAATFLHEANAIPGRANRFLAPFVDQIFVGFPMALSRLASQSVTMTGTPVRPQFQITDPAASRMALGLKPNDPVLLVMGGSQGAKGINELVAKGLPILSRRLPRLQYLHLTGTGEVDKVRQQYNEANLRAVVLPFLTEMELALSAATLAVSRAGASSLAEFAATELPSILIPYPYAADNHQAYNARSFAQTGAARQVEQKSVSSDELAGMIVSLIEDETARSLMKQALKSWHFPKSASVIADHILRFSGALPGVERIEQEALNPNPVMRSGPRLELQFRTADLR